MGQRIKGSRARLFSTRGTVLLEGLIALPVALIFLFSIIWVGYFLNSQTALTYAMSRAMRLGATRGDPKLAGGHPIEVLDKWKSGFSLSPDEEDKLHRLLMNGIEGADEQEKFLNALVHYNSKSTAELHKTLDHLPDAYLYILVYLNEAVRQAIGPAVRFPCDPTDSVNGQGCMSCEFNRKWSGSPTNKFHLTCKLDPGHFILQPVSGLLGVITGDSTLARPIITKELSFETTAP